MDDEPEATVFVIDDDPSVRNGLGRLLAVNGYRVKSYASADQFLAADRPEPPGCMVLDVRLPGMDGLELQRMVEPWADTLPVIFITAYGDIEASVLAMKHGALDFLQKPFRTSRLLQLVGEAVARSREALQRSAWKVRELQYLRALTPREYQVFRDIVAGRLNKQVAAALGITLKTVKIHRRHVMEKTGARSIAELVRLADRVGL